jgi:hypothetical protein
VLAVFDVLGFSAWLARVGLGEVETIYERLIAEAVTKESMRSYNYIRAPGSVSDKADSSDVGEKSGLIAPTIAQSLHVGVGQGGHGDHLVGCGGCLAHRGAAHRAADALHGRLDHLAAGRRIVVAGELVGVADRGDAPAGRMCTV